MDTELNINSLTGGEVRGDGIYDELMRVNKDHLVAEFEAGRITGDNYSKAYMALLESALANGIQYLLQYQLTNKNLLLMDEQILNAKKQNEILTAQIAKINAEISLLGKQELLMAAQVSKTNQEVLNLIKQEDLIDNQILLGAKDLLLKDAQLNQLTEQTKLITQQATNAITENATMLKQQLKMDAEIGVLNQKQVTEEAQTKDTVAGAPVSGVIGKQKILYQNQADGYIRDAEQKAAKIMNDTLITRITTDYDDANATTAGVSDTSVAAVMAKLKSGIGV